MRQWIVGSLAGSVGFFYTSAIVLPLTLLLVAWRMSSAEKHLRIVVPGRLVRGAWQTPDALRSIIAREQIKTIVTLTAINHDDPKYVGQSKIVSEMGVRWLLVPMRGSTATVAQMAQAADLLADSRLQPIFFHCIAGHHRTSLAHAAYLIRHRGWSAAAAWKEVANLDWARPTATADQNDRRKIEEFERAEQALRSGCEPLTIEVDDVEPFTRAPAFPVGLPAGGSDRRARARVPGMEPGKSQPRPGQARASLPVGTDASIGACPDDDKRGREIKTVLNLRGPNRSDSWYRDELATTRQEGATHVDIAMSSCLWMSRPQLRVLVDTLDKSERPLLIHCAWGSERTGLASAFAELLRPDSTLDDARAQFSIRYLFIRVNDGQVMAEHLDQYESWLRNSGAAHSPARFRQWANEGFQPGHPGREEWPYDPYPLVVVNRPEKRPGPPPVATENRSNRARQ